MGISTSPTIWTGDKGGRCYIRSVGTDLYWFGLHSDGQWIDLFSGTRFGAIVTGSWAEMLGAEGSVPKTEKLTVRMSADWIDVTYQTDRFAEKKLTAGTSGPIPFPKLPTHP
jgi:hypothetical protein